jgi:acetyl esterase/lipase
MPSIPSLPSRALIAILKLAGITGAFDRAFESGDFRSGDVAGPAKHAAAGLVVTVEEMQGRRVTKLRPVSGGTKTHVLFLHGGGYVFGFNRFHWDFACRLARVTGCTVVAPDYPLAPESTLPDSFAWVSRLYRELVSETGGADLVLLGDSAGGGLALALAQQALQRRIAQPRRIVLLSPWLDLTMSNPGIAALEPLDPVLRLSGLRLAAKAYAGVAPLDDPRLSPIHGPLEGLGRLSVFIGTRDVLLADARRLKSLLDEKGIDFDWYEGKGMIHDWVLLPVMEAKSSIDRIVEMIRE